MTKGIKTSLHEVRHAIIAELLDRKVLAIVKTGRWNGYTSFAIGSSGISHIVISIAPYIKRILTMNWNDFLDEYGQLTDISLNIRTINNLMTQGKLLPMVNVINQVLDSNAELINELVSYLDQNGKESPSKITRKNFKGYIKNHPLKGKELLLQIINGGN